HILKFNKINIFNISNRVQKKKNYLEKYFSIILLCSFCYFIIPNLFHGLYTEPYQQDAFWSKKQENNDSLPQKSFSNMFNPIKIEKIKKYNFSTIQKEELIKAGLENNFFDSNTTIYYSIPYSEKALIFLYQNKKRIITIYADIDDLNSSVKKIYDVGYINVK
ncbi:MAG: hypothetical protein J0647_09865, partial [Campylobacteraceae bacterium]|nr:hypothetical protein [Campylobacteraceae bacterium]